MGMEAGHVGMGGTRKVAIGKAVTELQLQVHEQPNSERSRKTEGGREGQVSTTD